MTGWLGPFALAVAFFAGGYGCVAWARSALTGRDSPGRWTAVLPLAGAAGAVLAAEWALLTHDFSVRFVAENGSRSTGLYYTVTSLWAAHDGSLLLWAMLLAGYLVAVAVRRPGSEALHRWAMVVLSGVTTFFCGLALFTGHVFETVSPAPGDGPGPNPLLQDHPAMGVHPPLLYAGLLGTAVPFAYAVAALVTGDVGAGWLRVVRSWALTGWALLTAGIVVGAWWSYSVLGWGGYWAWDPVENASLMPWLVTTALLHAVMVQHRRGSLPAWNLSLAVAAFMLACLGSFLTRSGVVDSVHAFADSTVGPVLLGFVAALAVGVVALVLLRSDRLSAAADTGPVLSRGTAILLGNVLLVAMAVTVLAGTLFPLLAEWVRGQRISLGAPYFDAVAVPVVLVLLTLMSVGPMLRWRGERAADVAIRSLPAVAVGAATVLTVSLAAPASTAASLAFGLAALVGTATLRDVVVRARAHGGRTGLWRWATTDRHRAGGLLAHLGVALAAVGIAASSSYGTVTERTVHEGGTVSAAGTTLHLDAVDRSRDARAMATTARLEVGQGNGRRAASPALRFYPAHGMTVASPAVLSSARGDLYLTLLSARADGVARLRVAVNPLVGWIWAGGGLVVAGAGWALWPRRRRSSWPSPDHSRPPDVRRPEDVRA